MTILSHLDLLTVGIIIAATGILGSVAFFNNPKSITNKSFLAFCVLTIIWGSLNYLSYQITIPKLAFWLLKISIFSAVWHAFFLFQLLYVFPKEAVIWPKLYKYCLLPFVMLTALSNLTSFTFQAIAELSVDGRITKVTNGPGIILFSTLIFGFIISGIIIFIYKLRKGKELDKKQGKPVIIGVITTFSCILIFNFILPAFFNNSQYIELGALFFFPFIMGIGYSIFKHKLLNLKIISTEILTFVLALVILLEAINSADVITLLFKTSIFILVVCLGILLIKTVIKEVRQREQLEILDKELAEANEKLTVLDKARAEFISIASHQLRTPPATVKWYLASILSGDYGEVPANLKEIIIKAERSNNLLIALIEDILNVSRIERGTLEFLFEEVDFYNLAKITFEQLEPLAQDKKIKLEFICKNLPLPKIMADKEKLRQVMNNLIDNAIKYTPSGQVQIIVSMNQTEVRFEVKDSGKGISPDELNKIFEKYTRGKESFKQAAGLGLGLYVAKIVIKEHQGKIWAESPGEGKGSSFIFTLPIHSHLNTKSQVDFNTINSTPKQKSST